MRLPTGTWDVTALTSVHVGDCGQPESGLKATVRVLVVDTGPGATFQQGAEALPGPGQVMLVADPPEAAEPLTIEFAGQDGEVRGLPTQIQPGATVSASTVSLPGKVTVHVNGKACDGTVPVRTDMTTTVVLLFARGGCSIAVQGLKPT